MEELTFFETILQSAIELGPTQWLAVIFSIAYVILAAKESIWCWPFGIIGCVLSFIVYADPEVKLYSDAMLQVFYIGMSIFGWWNWNNNAKEATDVKKKVEISRWPLKNHFIALIVGGFLAVLLGYFWTWMNAALPYADAFTTSFSIIATVMVTQKIIENWIYWIIIDLACIVIYLERELYLFTFLFLIYTVIAFFGYLNWKRQLSSNLKGK